jgi:hypothetical protein
MATTTCGHCGKRFSYDQSFFAASPPSGDSLFDGHICSDCAAEQNEKKRHKEREKAADSRVSEQSYSDSQRLQEEKLRHEESLKTSARQHNEILELERHRQEADERRHAEIRADHACELQEKGKAALSTAIELLKADLYDESLKATLRAQEFLGFSYDIAFLKLELAKRINAPGLSESVFKNLEEIAYVKYINNAEEKQVFVSCAELIETFGDKVRAQALRNHLEALWVECSVAIHQEETKRFQQEEASRRNVEDAKKQYILATAQNRATKTLISFFILVSLIVLITVNLKEALWTICGMFALCLIARGGLTNHYLNKQ